MGMVSFTLQQLYSQGKNPGTNWIGGWVGPRADLDAVVKRKIPNEFITSDAVNTVIICTS
jgi:hypothetical protein